MVYSWNYTSLSHIMFHISYQNAMIMTNKHNFICYMWGRRLYRERTGVCEMTVKRTRLCYWIARPAKPGVQSSNTSRVRFTVNSHTRVRSRFYHIHILYKRNWDGSWLMNLTQKKVTRTYIFFKFAMCSIALLSLGETCHLKGRDMVTVWRGLNTYCDVTQCMNGLWIFITKHESPKDDS